ncbi:MMPL family transporter [Nonomuraea candida]|uniref:MMPL family transporter n=1 Tax=Nonomuraea candida TaxID=359159 RepID=UPI0005BABC59|nr:MMPL family transporter [Nonomuraea candida]
MAVSSDAPTGEPAPGPPAAGDRRRRSVWCRLGLLAARRHRLVLAVWLVLVAGSAVLVPGLVERSAAPAIRVEGSGSADAARLLQQGFPQLGGEQMLMVFASATLTDADGPYQRALHDATRAVAARPLVGGVRLLPAVPGQDRRRVYALLGVNGDQRARQEALPSLLRAAGDAADRASGGRVEVHVVAEGALLTLIKRTDLADLQRAELLAVPLSLLALAAGLGAIGAAAAVLAVAGAVTVTCLGLLGVASLLGVTVNTFMLAVAATVGLGLGLDYALLILLRYRQSRAAGHDRHEAAGAAVSTAGRTAIWCALGVALTSAALLVVRTPMIRTMAVAVCVAAVVAAAVAVTLPPALLVAADRWLLRRRAADRWFLRRRAADRWLLRRRAADRWLLRRRADRQSLRRRAAAPAGGDGWARWARHLMRHPVAYTLACSGALLLAAAPLTGARLGFDLDRPALAGTDFARGLAHMEADGIASAVAVVLPHPAGTPPVAASALVAALKDDPRVSLTASVDNGHDLTVVIVFTRTSLDDPATTELARQITGRLAPATLPPGQQVYVTGPTMIFSDLMDETAAQLGTVIPLVLGCSLVFLLVTFRSVVLPVKAVVMNLLAVLAAFGLLTLATRHLPGLVGAEVNTLVPLLAFTLVFGLSIDYEIFLIHRVAEHYQVHGDNTAAVADGLTHTARPITVAAACMVATFAALLTADSRHLVQLGLTVAVAIVLDATLIRLVLVPALMRLFGDRNWWLPFARHSSS